MREKFLHYRKHALFVLNVAVFVMLAVFAIKTAAFACQQVGSENFVSWFYAKLYNDIFLKYGERRGVAAYQRHFFLPSDVADPRGLASLLLEPKRPFDRYIASLLPPGGKDVLRTAEGGGGRDLKSYLADFLNSVARRKECIYEKSRMEGVQLSDTTMLLLVVRGYASKEDFGDALQGEGFEQTPTSRRATLVDINRMILEDALGELVTPVPSGETVWMNLAPHKKLYYYVVPLGRAAFLLGVLVGLGMLFWRLRGEGSIEGDGKELSARWGLALSFAGLFWHGYVLGLAGYLAAERVRSVPWRVGTKVFSFFTVMFWAVGVDLYWGAGWSKIYPFVNTWLKTVFGVFGITF